MTMGKVECRFYTIQTHLKSPPEPKNYSGGKTNCKILNKIQTLYKTLSINNNIVCGQGGFAPLLYQKKKLANNNTTIT
jgi:hypothetical protein